MSSGDRIGELLPTRRVSPVFKYGFEKAIALARSGVDVMDEIIQSIVPVRSAGIRPSNAMFSMIIVRPRYFPSDLASSTLMPSGRPAVSVISNGG